MTQGIEEQIGALPAIETEAHLFEIGREMLGAGCPIMPGAFTPTASGRVGFLSLHQ